MPDYQKFMMRHGEHSVQFIVEQIEKVEGIKYGPSALLEDRWDAIMKAAANDKKSTAQ